MAEFAGGLCADGGFWQPTGRSHTAMAKDAAKYKFLILYFCLKNCCLVFTFYQFLSLHSDAALCSFHIALQDICWPTSLQRKWSMLVLSPCWHAGSGEQLQGKQISGLVLVGIFYPGVRILPGSLLTSTSLHAPQSVWARAYLRPDARYNANSNSYK